MSTRDRLLAEAVGLVLSGESVDVVGDRGSGRTSLLDAVKSHFVRLGWSAVTVRGIASLQSNPLAALAVVGIGVGRDGRHPSIISASADLRARLPQGRSVLLVDDWDDLDEATWGVLSSLRLEDGIPIVVSKLRQRSGITPTGLPASSRASARVLEIAPLRYEELGSALADLLESPVDPPALSRIYAKSGGNIGMALALVDAAVREQRLEQRDGLWVATQDLWSPSLALLIEPMLQVLSDDERDLLEVVSLLGMADVVTLAQLPGGTELAHLEERSLIGLFPSGTRWLVGIQPPMLAEYLRHSPFHARRELLSQAIEQVLRDSDDPLLIPISTAGEAGSDQAAQFVRIVHEGQRNRAAAARIVWEASATLRAAQQYAVALMDSSTVADELDDLFDASAMLDGDVEDRVAWELAFAEHRAFNRVNPIGAIERLRQRAVALQSAGVPLLARAVEIEQALLRAPDTSELEALLANDPAGAHAPLLHRALAYVQTCRGRIGDSERHVQAIRGALGDEVDLLTVAVSGMNLVARGRLTEAAKLFDRGMDDARGRFDAIALRSHAAIGAFCRMLEGRYDGVEELLEAVFTIGEPSWRPAFSQLSLTVVASVVAMRRGKRRLAEQRLAEAERLRSPDGPLPGEQRGLAYTQEAASAGDFLLAADIATDTADQLWERGAYFAAAIGYAGAIELDPTPVRLEATQARIEQVEGAYVAELLEFSAAIVAQDPERLLRAADEFERSERFGMALAAYDRSATLYEEHGAVEDAGAVRARAAELRSMLPPATYDSTRFHAVFVELTEREREIARLASRGLTNQQIADELVLSVRTVESHIHRVMRKTKVDRRADLREFLDRIDADQNAVERVPRQR